MHVHAVVIGRVQGICYRAFVQSTASSLGLTGWVRNLDDPGKVVLEAEGDEDKLKRLIDRLKVGPSGARVDRIDLTWSESGGSGSVFEIRYD
jgi:acylphosphatase